MQIVANILLKRLLFFFYFSTLSFEIYSYPIPNKYFDSELSSEIISQIALHLVINFVFIIN